MLNSVRLRDEPQMMSLGSEVKGGRRTLWVLPVRKEAIHLRASFWIPTRCNLLIRVWWDTEDQGRCVSPVEEGSDVVGGSYQIDFSAVVAAESGL